VIASGGIATADDVTKLNQLPVAGCIIGRALYEGTLKLADALARAR
jgi:phosphoribosylformimino-5-aminoimidazole carboxamide ribotide isomerase